MLNACTKATAEEKNKIYSEKFPDRQFQVKQEFKQGRSLFKTNHPSKTLKSNQAEIAPVKQDAKEQPQKSSLKTRQRTAPAWAKADGKCKAQYVVHHASVAAATTAHKSDLYCVCPFWDIQSDAKAKLYQSMKGSIENWQRESCSVELATGALMHVPLQGTVKIKVQDTHRENWCYVLMHNVLHVPEFTRRLMSVRQWDITGGDLSFEMDHYTLTVCNATTGQSEQYAVKSPYDSTQPELQTPQVSGHKASFSNAIPQNYVESLLPHRRMGHRSIPTLFLSSKNKLWIDTRSSFENDRMCEDCKTEVAELHTRPLEAIKTDADPIFESQKFLQDCEDYKIGLSHAAPRHQEMNGLAERNWKSVRELAFSMMVYAHVGNESNDFALDHAWKVNNCLPIKGLEKNDVPATPNKMFFGSKPSLDKFQVLFCPIIVGIGDKSGPATNDGEPRQVHRRYNTPERAIRDFETTCVRLDSRSRFACGIPLQPHPQNLPDDDQAEVIGFTPLPDQRGESESESHLTPGISTNLQNSFLYTDVETPEDPAPSLQRQNSNDSILFNHQDFEDKVQDVREEYEETGSTIRWKPDLTQIREFLSSQPATAPPPRRSALLHSQEATTLAAAIKIILQEDEPLDLNPCEQRKIQLKVDANLQRMKAMTHYPEAKQQRKLKAIRADDLFQTTDPKELDADIFKPAPENWKQFLVLPPHLKKFWIDLLSQEIITLLKEVTFIQELKPDNKPTIPFRSKMRIKVQANRKLKKAKVRVCLRGDQQEEWAELLPEYMQWCNIPLRLNKSLYEYVTANKCWYDELSSWLVNVYGFARCLSEPSDFIKCKNGRKLVIVNNVVDQLYYSTFDGMRKAFEAAISKKYNVEIMGQAYWYLQACVTQSANHVITIDQSKYIAVICNMLLPQKRVEGSTDAERKEYAATIFYSYVASKEDRSETYVQVLQLQEEFGLEHASVIGVLVYLMITAFVLHFDIIKLGKFDALPGKKHLKAVKNMINHLRCNHTSFGITHRAGTKRFPLNQLLKDHVGAELNPTLTLFTDSSWQDCPDSERSTEDYLLYQQGRLIDRKSCVLKPVALLSAEAEYNALAYAIHAVTSQHQNLQELRNNHPEVPLTILFYYYLEGELIMEENLKDTKNIRHTQCKTYHSSDDVAPEVFKDIKINDKIHTTDTGTKNLPSTMLSPTLVSCMSLCHLRQAALEEECWNPSMPPCKSFITWLLNSVARLTSVYTDISSKVRFEDEVSSTEVSMLSQSVYGWIQLAQIPWHSLSWVTHSVTDVTSVTGDASVMNDALTPYVTKLWIETPELRIETPGLMIETPGLRIEMPGLWLRCQD